MLCCSCILFFTSKKPDFLMAFYRRQNEKSSAGSSIDFFELPTTNDIEPKIREDGETDMATG